MGQSLPSDQLAWAWLSERDAPPGGDLVRVLGSRRGFGPGDDALAENAPPGQCEPYVLRPVTRYAELAPRGRPPAYCPTCLSRVTLKLGRKLRHHYAHQAEQRGCPASTPEGALHLDAKLHLAATLSGGGGSIHFQQVCAGWARRGGSCVPGPVTRWDVTWDAVEVERTVGGVRPDLVLLSEGTPAFAIEVYASHAVDPEKRATLSRLSIPWIEVSARSVLPEAASPWNAEEPLVARAHWDTECLWRCGPCAAGFAEEEHFRANGVHRMAWRPVHLYVTDHGRLGANPELQDWAVTLVAQRRNGIPVSVWLTRESTGAPLSPRRSVAHANGGLATGHELFRAWVREERRRPGAIVDSPLGWASLSDWEAPEMAPRRYPARYGWNRWLQRWSRVPGELLPWPLSGHPGEAEQAFAVSGPCPLAWTDLEPGRVTHFAAGHWWLSVRRHAGRIQLHALRHNGLRWVERPCPEVDGESDLGGCIRLLQSKEPMPPEVLEQALRAFAAVHDAPGSGEAQM